MFTISILHTDASVKTYAASSPELAVAAAEAIRDQDPTVVAVSVTPADIFHCVD